MKVTITKDELITRVMAVILSCKSLEQLNVASNYANIAIRFIDDLSMRDICLIERSIGYAQCYIKCLEAES